MTQPQPKPKCIHHGICTLNNSLIREILPKGKSSYLWCEDTVRLSKDGQCPHEAHTPAAPAEPVKFPNSTELLLMAHTDWKNRIERKHTHDEIPWTDGWIHGYLTPKPDWKRKEQHDTAIRNATLDEAINVVNAFERKPKYDYEVTKCLLITQSLEALKKKVETRDLK